MTGDNSMNRREWLKAAALAEVCATLPTIAAGQSPPGKRSAYAPVLAYLSSLSRPDGGYAWGDQEASHLSPTYAVIGCYRVLGLNPPNSRALSQYVRTHHPFHIKKLERDLKVYEFQQIQSLLWLGEDVASFRTHVQSWKRPFAYAKQYERHGYPIFRFEMMAFLGRAMLRLPLDDLSPAFLDYLDERRRPNGSFNNTPATDGGDGHVANTWWGLQALRALGRAGEKKPETIAWLRQCQLPGGGFTYQPRAAIGGVEDAFYTWAAVRALKELGSAPADRDACVRHVASLANVDGGRGDRPGWPSNPMATYYALDALEALGALESAPQPRPAPPAKRALPSGLKVYTVQIESHGKGSPAEAVDLARALKVHLWGAKNATPAWLARAQAEADRRKVPVTFFLGNEEYGTWVDVPGMGTYSHTSDIFAPAGAPIGPSLANQGVVSWPEFRERRLAPLEKAGGRVFWQFGENEELCRIFLDDSLERGGFAAISTFHFGNPDFTNSEAFLNRYRMKIPFIALQDAHGDEPWWFADMTTGFRTLFLAEEPTWEGWLKALENNWVVAVRHDSVSGFATWMHGGPHDVVDFVKERRNDWAWWDNPAIQRPLVSIVPLSPESESEVGRPEKGIALRIRCAWENTTQGMPRKPITELVELTVDGRTVEPKLVTRPRPNGQGLADHYHLFSLPDAAAGGHTATAVVRRVDTGERSSRTLEF